MGANEGVVEGVIHELRSAKGHKDRMLLVADRVTAAHAE